MDVYRTSYSYKELPKPMRGIYKSFTPYPLEQMKRLRRLLLLSLLPLSFILLWCEDNTYECKWLTMNWYCFENRESLCYYISPRNARNWAITDYTIYKECLQDYSWDFTTKYPTLLSSLTNIPLWLKSKKKYLNKYHLNCDGFVLFYFLYF
jgi:hypothetical protein